MLHAVLLVLALANPAVLPNATLTPGAVQPLSKAQICETKWGLDRRMVTLAMKKQVAAEYGIPWKEHAKFEVDHKIPRELGGRDSIDNLWEEPWSVVVDGRQMGAHQKDRAENATHKAVCDGRITLGDAQRGMASDWTVLYRRFVGEFPKATK